MNRDKLKTLVERLLAEYRNSNQRGEEKKLSVYHDALPLGVVIYLWFFLRSDGKLLAFNLLHDDVTAEFDDDLSLAYAVRLGSKRFPEFESLLPSRPAEASPCESCHGTGKGETVDWDPCSECYGRGWLENKVQELIERTSAELNRCKTDQAKHEPVVQSFIQHGDATGLPPSTLVTFFGNAMKRAGIDRDDQQKLLDTLESAGQNWFGEKWAG